MKPKDFRIEELRIVRAIAETASVSKAAQLLDMPQSNVSRALTALGWLLGLELFIRSPRALALTEFGAQFLRRAALLLDEHSDLLDMSGTYKRSLNGMVTLGAPIGIDSFLARYLLPAAAASGARADRRFAYPQSGRTREKIWRGFRH